VVVRQVSVQDLEEFEVGQAQVEVVEVRHQFCWTISFGGAQSSADEELELERLPQLRCLISAFPLDCRFRDLDPWVSLGLVFQLELGVDQAPPLVARLVVVDQAGAGRIRVLSAEVLVEDFAEVEEVDRAKVAIVSEPALVELVDSLLVVLDPDRRPEL